MRSGHIKRLLPFVLVDAPTPQEDFLSLSALKRGRAKDGVPDEILTRVTAVRERLIHDFKGLQEADDL